MERTVINLPSGIELEFDSQKHQYFRDGRQVQGVTKIAGMMGDPGWRIPWTGNMAKARANRILKGYVCGDGFTVGEEKHYAIDEVNYPRIAESIGRAHRLASDRAIDFGNAAHGWLETFINWKMGRGSEPTKLKNREVRAAVAPFFDWSCKYGPDYIATEQFVYYEGYVGDFYFDYAGTLDVRFILDDRHCIGDFKTAKNLSTDYVWQMALYSAACEQSYPGRAVDDMYIFKLPKTVDGKLLPWMMKTIQVDDVYRTLAPHLAAAKLKDLEAKKFL